MKASTYDIRAMVMGIVLALVAFCPPGTTAGAAGQATEKKQYVCPPCGCGRDDEVLEKAGFCASCGMQLVVKGSEAARPAPAQPQASRENVAILIFQGVQIIDYTGPYEVFGQAGFNVFTVAEKPDTLSTAMGMKVTPNYTLEDAPSASVLVIPGGDVGNTQENPNIIKWIQQESKNAEYVLSVCNGAFILAKTGLIDGQSATTFYGLLDGLRSLAPKVNVVDDRRFVDNGKFITTAGLSSGIDGSLYLISKMVSKARAQMVALNMEYNWQPGSGYARASFADMHLQALFGRGLAFAVPEGAELRVVSTEGGKDKWEIDWLLQIDASPSDALKILDARLASSGSWSRQNASSAATATKTSWRFTDKKGGQWNGQTSVQPIGGQKNRYNLTLRIDRATGAANASTREPYFNPDAERIVIKDAWIQQMPPSRNFTAAFMVIENGASAETALVGARSDAASVVELHKMESEGDMMRMRKVDDIKIPAGGKVEMTGGFHLMLIGLNASLREGDEVPVTLEFANRVRKTVLVPVKRREQVQR